MGFVFGYLDWSSGAYWTRTNAPRETIFMYIDSYTRFDLICKVTKAVPIYLNTIQHAKSRRSNTKRKWVTITPQEQEHEQGLIGDRLGELPLPARAAANRG